MQEGDPRRIYDILCLNPRLNPLEAPQLTMRGMSAGACDSSARTLSRMTEKGAVPLRGGAGRGHCGNEPLAQSAPPQFVADPPARDLEYAPGPLLPPTPLT